MAPVPDSGIKFYLSTILKRTPSPAPTPTLSDLSPKAAALIARAQVLLPRNTPVDPGRGVTPPDTIPNKFVFVVFGLIGFGFVVTGIWFFFWAKNGGFYFKENDWDDYKSTVLRRKGPNGTTLSGATESTDLGGGSVVHGEKNGSRWGRKRKEKRYKDFDEETAYTGSAGGSSLGSELSAFKKKVKKERKGKKDKKAMTEVGTEAETMTEVGTVDEEMDVGVRDAVRAYRHEKPARVGGLNKQPDGSSWDGSNDHSSAASDLLSHREKTPTNTPTKSRKERKDNYTGGTGGIRKVVSTSQPAASENGSFWTRTSGTTETRALEEDHIKAEARKLQEKGRAAQRRDFSFQVGDDSTVASEREERTARREERERRRASRSPVKKMPGSYTYESAPQSEIGSAVSSDLGTKSYHHPIPGLSVAGSDYAEERRKKRNGGYRRGRRDSLSDGEH